MIGKSILHYTIIEELGYGGMGVIYKAKDTKLGRTVAIKFLPNRDAINPDERIRFKREAMAVATLNHPNIATIHGLEEVDDRMFIVMEFIEGRELRDILSNAEEMRRVPVLPIEAILRLAIQIVKGLQAAHEEGIVHRDIKPENVMINTKDQVKITDFGLAKITGAELLTKTGTIVGTVAYMSPEQARGAPVDQRTDIWSVGVILYEMITGQRPFRGEYEHAVMYSILNENPEPLKLKYPAIPEKLEQIIGRTLAKNPSDRYQNCEQLLNDLQSCIHSTGPSDALDLQATAPEPETQGNAFKRLQRSASRRLKFINRQWRLPWMISIGIILLAVAGTYIFLRKSHPDREHGKKIAVLPFININKDPADEYFSDGIMEDILTQLVKISELKVISRTTMMRYKNTNKTLREISNELDADVVLEGSVRRDADRLRISVQLINANTDEHLWAESYDRELDQVFVIQSEIAQKIASTLKAKLSPAEKELLDLPKTYNPDVYNLLLKGRYFVNRLDSVNIAKGIDLYTEAGAIDPRNARVWAYLANAYTVQADCGYVSIDEGYSKGREMVDKALLLDDKLAIAHTVSGIIKLVYDWDWEGAEIECQKAIEIEPGNTTTINLMGQLARTLGRLEEAIEYIQRAINLEPVIVINYVYLAHFLMYADRLDEAVGIVEKGMELNSQFPYLHYLLGCVYLLHGKPENALVEMEKESFEPYRMYGLPLIYHALGRQGEADAALQECITKYHDIGSYNIAKIYAYRGDSDRAFEWLEKAYALRDVSLPEIKGDPFLKNIERDPRYAAFMKKMKLPL